MNIALALSGGGSKGAFTVGVLSALRASKLRLKKFRLISGTSTGSLVGTLLTTGEWGKLRHVYRNVQTENIVNPNHALIATIAGPSAVLFSQAILGGRSIYDAAALRATVRANVDFDVVRANSAETLLVYNVVDLESGKLETYDNATHGKTVLEDALMASASIPVFMEPVSMQGSTFADGGVLEWLPLRGIYDRVDVPIDHIIAIGTEPLSPKKKAAPEGIVDVLGRTIDLLLTEVGRTDYDGALLFNSILRMVENAGPDRSKILKGVPREIRRRLTGKRAIPVTFIGPSKHLDIDPLSFDPVVMKRIMSLGVTAGKNAAKKLPEALGQG